MVFWVVTSPVLWWITISKQFGVQTELQFLVQPIALAIAGIISLPFLWRLNRSAAVILFSIALVISLSIVLLATAFPHGVLLNAALLAGVSFAVWHNSSKASRANSEA